MLISLCNSEIKFDFSPKTIQTIELGDVGDDFERGKCLKTGQTQPGIFYFQIVMTLY